MLVYATHFNKLKQNSCRMDKQFYTVFSSRFKKRNIKQSQSTLSLSLVHAKCIVYSQHIVRSFSFLLCFTYVI